MFISVSWGVTVSPESLFLWLGNGHLVGVPRVQYDGQNTGLALRGRVLRHPGQNIPDGKEQPRRLSRYMVACPRRAEVTHTLCLPTTLAMASKVSPFFFFASKIACVACSRVSMNDLSFLHGDGDRRCG